MKKTLLITTISLSIIFASCGKKDKVDPDPLANHYDDNLSIVTSLTDGDNNSSGWRLTESGTAYYNSDQRIIYTNSNVIKETSIWEFLRKSGTNYFQMRPSSEYTKDGEFYNPDRFVISTDNKNTTYLVVYSASNSKEARFKYEIVSIDNSSGTLLLRTDDVEPLIYNNGGVTTTSHHAIKSYLFRRL